MIDKIIYYLSYFLFVFLLNTLSGRRAPRDPKKPFHVYRPPVGRLELTICRLAGRVVFLMRRNHLVIYELTHRLFLQPGINLLETRLRLGTRPTTEPARPLSKMTSLRLWVTVVPLCSSREGGEGSVLRWHSKKSTTASCSLLRSFHLVWSTEGQRPLFKQPVLLFTWRSITAAPRACMTAEIMRGGRIARSHLLGRAEFAALVPQRNFLTSLLIKSAHTHSKPLQPRVDLLCVSSSMNSSRFLCLCPLGRGAKSPPGWEERRGMRVRGGVTWVQNNSAGLQRFPGEKL